MDIKETTDGVHQPPQVQQPPSTALVSPIPPRRRSKMACDTCHYRKIKCDVDKCHPCKNCEKNAVQCTRVGPAMRPPRSTSGSSSAAAAAAVAMAVATAAAANTYLANGPPASDPGQFFESGTSPEFNGTWLPHREEASNRPEETDNTPPVLPKPTRRASASGKMMRIPDELSRPNTNTNTSDMPNGKRPLLSSSSSPTSLRTLFNTNATVARPPSSSSSSSSPFMTSGSSVLTSQFDGAYFPNSANQDTQMDLRGVGSCEYFDHPISFSSGSSTSSTPSGPLVQGGIAFFGQTGDSLPGYPSQVFSPLSSPSIHASSSSSLPPTPMLFHTDKIPDSILATLSAGNPPSHFQATVGSTQHPAPYPQNNIPRRASSSMLPSTERDSKFQHHDRRTSAPWVIYDHAHPPSAHELRYSTQPHGQLLPRPHSQASTMEASILQKRYPHGPSNKDDVQPQPPSQSMLVRSNSTPAVLRSPLKTTSRNRHSNGPTARRSYASRVNHSLGLYASTDKVIQDLSLPRRLLSQQATPQRNTYGDGIHGHHSAPNSSYNVNHLQFQLQLQQLQLSHLQNQQQQQQQPPRQRQRQSWQENRSRQQGLGDNFQQGFDCTTDASMGSILSAQGAPMVQDCGVDTEAPLHRVQSYHTGTLVSGGAFVGSPGAEAADFLAYAGHMAVVGEMSPQVDVGSNGLDREGGLKLDLSQQQGFMPGQDLGQPSFADQHSAYHSQTQVAHHQKQHQQQQIVYIPPQLQGSQGDRQLSHGLFQPVPNQATLDAFGASLALVLDDHLRILDDMDMIQEMSSCEEGQRQLQQQQRQQHPASNSLAPLQIRKTSILVGEQSPGGTLSDLSSPASALSPCQATLSMTSPALNGSSFAESLVTAADFDGQLSPQDASILHFQDQAFIESLSFLEDSDTMMDQSALSSIPRHQFMGHGGIADPSSLNTKLDSGHASHPNSSPLSFSYQTMGSTDPFQVLQQQQQHEHQQQHEQHVQLRHHPQQHSPHHHAFSSVHPQQEQQHL